MKRPLLLAEVDLLDWGEKGSVLSDLDARTVTIDRGIPGERAHVLVDQRRRPWRGVVTDVLAPSPSRVQPPCPHYFQDCGGCQWQHVSYQAQLNAKHELVHREFDRVGLERRVDFVHGMADPWRYRRTAAIAIGWEAGFRPRGRRGIVEIRDCLIAHPLIGELSSHLNELLREGRLLNYHGKVWLDCQVIGAGNKATVQVLLQGISGLTLETHPELPDVATELIQHRSISGVGFRHRQGDMVALAGDTVGAIEVDGKLLRLPAGSFFQTNLALLPAVIARMRAAIGGTPIRQAADVYGGVGTFAFALAEAAGEMYLVELDPAAVTAAQLTATELGLNNLHFVCTHAERALPTLPDLDLVIVDPPRSGLGPAVVAAVIDRRAPLVLYLSCAPRSLADDLRLMIDGGYEITSLDLFDFYPQTYHIESLATLRLRS